MFYGFDIGGTKIEFAVYDENLQCVLTHQVPTPKDEYAELLAVICDLALSADSQFKCKGVIGIGYPGFFDKVKKEIVAPNLASLHGRNLQQDLALRIDRIIKFQNDANCFALSECYEGGAHEAEVALAITLGTGLGGAVCINKQVIEGRNSSAGEFGHMSIPGIMLQRYPELPLTYCGCGRQSCLETYSSGTGLALLYSLYDELMNDKRNGTSLSGHEIISAYEADDEIAIKAVTVYFDILAAGLANLIMVLDPDVIVFGGGLSRFNDIYKALPERLSNYVFDNMNLPKLVKAKFGAEGGVRGAALLNYSV